MYKVFINNHPLILTDSAVKEVFGKDTLFVRYDSDETVDTLLRLAHELPVFFKMIYLVGGNADELFGLLRSRCKWIEAAGGRVKNAEGKTLLIFRSGKWDLPKGKIDDGETPQKAAVREVEEECGIGGLKIIRPLEPTFHTYLHKGKIVLKKTWWYEMNSSDTNTLVPQTEEGITEVKWMNEKEIEKAMENTFLSILDVMNES